MAKFYILTVACGTQVGHVHPSRTAAFAEAEALIDELGERASVEEYDEAGVYGGTCSAGLQIAEGPLEHPLARGRKIVKAWQEAR
jgi:hypothetical protein